MLRDLFNNMPVVTKNLFLLCILMFIVQLSGENAFNGEGMTHKLGVYYIFSPYFEPYQVITHMFCHGNVPHLLFNMLALISIGSLLERVWGPKRFLVFYLITGLGAVCIHEFAIGYDLYRAVGQWKVSDVTLTHDSINYNELLYTEKQAQQIMGAYLSPTLGASGAVFGLLVGLAMLFPNIELMFIFLPIPIKAKYLVPVYVVIELMLGMKNYEMDNIAHFAHLGGALFGFILIKLWQKNRTNFY
ncbi:MAG: rhomboid family intramembrane serine protease [Flavobacteriales bacterium]